MYRVSNNNNNIIISNSDQRRPLQHTSTTPFVMEQLEMTRMKRQMSSVDDMVVQEDQKLARTSETLSVRPYAWSDPQNECGSHIIPNFATDNMSRDASVLAMRMIRMRDAHRVQRSMIKQVMEIPTYNNNSPSLHAYLLGQPTSSSLYSGAAPWMNSTEIQRRNNESGFLEVLRQSDATASYITSQSTACASTLSKELSSDKFTGGGHPMGVDASFRGTSQLSLPTTLSHPNDHLVMTEHQVVLRKQIEVFAANEDDISTHIRGRNKPIRLGQVGIRCRHCAHYPTAIRPKSSMYFPATTLGLYQAAQNMSSSHIQCGLCPAMPDDLKMEFVRLIPTKKAASSAGRVYWAECAKHLGLVDTEDNGIDVVYGNF